MNNQEREDIEKWLDLYLTERFGVISWDAFIEYDLILAYNGTPSSHHLSVEIAIGEIYHADQMWMHFELDDGKLQYYMKATIQDHLDAMVNFNLWRAVYFVYSDPEFTIRIDHNGSEVAETVSASRCSINRRTFKNPHTQKIIGPFYGFRISESGINKSTKLKPGELAALDALFEDAEKHRKTRFGVENC